jgi:hypothetical protein
MMRKRPGGEIMASDAEFDDGDFDDDEAAMARFREAEARLRNTPPRCLSGFKVEPAQLKGVVFDGHGSDLNKVYKLACTCGHDRFRVLGHHTKNDRGDAIFVGPLALQCARCAKVTELIDTARHGYNAELGYAGTTLRGQGARTPYACDRCGVRPMTSYARFEHSALGDVLADSFLEDHPDSQDFFSWFSFVGTCDRCGRTLNVADFECA